MTIVFDHCVPRRYGRLLDTWGYKAELASAHIASESPDVDNIALALKLDAALLTVDLDFANILDYHQRLMPGSSSCVIGLRTKRS